MITGNSKNILIADDSLFFRTKLSDIVVEAGHRARFARDGREVLNEIRTNRDGIDLLVLDLQMPDVDGFGVLEWINNNGFRDKFPVLAVTGIYEPSNVMERLKSLGAAGLMTKAFTPEQALFRVNKLLFPEKWKYGSPRKRVPVSIPADFTIDNVTRTGFLLNLAESGAFLHSDVAYPAGTEIRLRFSLPWSDKVLDVDGVVRWLAGGKTGRGLFCGYGITFNPISREDQETLKNFVDAETKRLGLEDGETGL